MNNSPPTEEPPHTLLTVPEAAAVLRMSASTIYRWSCTGQNPHLFVRVPRGGRGERPALRVDSARLDAHIASGTRA